MRRHKRPRPHLLHISRLFPNMLTLLGLCAGLSAIRFALAERWELAVGMVLVAAFMDGIDGRLARLLKSTSAFGAQLDSLCDAINFGVVPALLLFLWKTHVVKGLGWAAVLLFSVCCVLRLARFNTQLDDSGHNKISDRFFQGVPAPAGAILSLVPLMLYFWNRDTAQSREFAEILTTPEIICVYQFILAFLLISRIPTFSGKKLAFNPRSASLILFGVAVIFILFLSEPWLVIPVIAGIYLAGIPVSLAFYYRQERFGKSGRSRTR